MYMIETEISFDSAHFLSGYQGKCGNIHGHRWTVKVAVKGEQLDEEATQTRGMLMDFSDLKAALRDMGDKLDHVFIIEQGTLAADTFACLQRDGFKLVEVPFRPTAENFARWFYEELEQKGFSLDAVTVYETPNNCAVYRMSSM
jgi:6-pyruvoyltetrahydropterin/6-carboxytetrahydropterin synthase